MTGKWCSIKSWEDLKVGMKISSCLDMDHVMATDKTDDLILDYIWYDGIVANIKDPNNSYQRHYGPNAKQIDIIREDHDGGIWHTIITPNNLYAMEIWTTNDWDE